MPQIKLEDIYKEVRKLESRFSVNEIKNIKRELAMLKTRQAHLEDALLSADDVEALTQAREDLKKKRTISLFELKKKLNM